MILSQSVLFREVRFFQFQYHLRRDRQCNSTVPGGGGESSDTRGQTDRMIISIHVVVLCAL